MIKNYLKIALANIYKSKIYSLISISSLSVGMAVCILLLLYVTHELSYDRYHEKADNIYRLCQDVHPYQAPGVAQLLTENLPEIVSSARILPRDNINVQFDNKRFKEDEVAWVDPALFDIFSFNFIVGTEGSSSLQQPGTVVITKSTAKKYFGNENPIGKTIKVGNEYDYLITAVIEDIPDNSHFKFDIFMTLEDGAMMFGNDWMDSWGWCNFLVYFEMQDKFSKPDVEAKISQILISVDSPNAPTTAFTIQNVVDIHLYSSHFLGDIQPQNSIIYVLIFSAIGLLILFIASFNYVNLFTANATTRLTEISVRKTFGASRHQLAMQFIFESVLIFFVSFCVSLLLVGLALPLFNEFSGKALSFSILANTNIILSLLGMMMVVGILAGWYPALVLSSYSPTGVLKSSLKSSSGFQIKKLLIGTQFTIVIALIACAIIMYGQINFLETKDLGFEKEAVITTIFDFGDEAKYNTLKHELLSKSYVSNVSVASRIPSGDLGNQSYAKAEGQEESILIPYVHVTFDYFRTLGIEPIEGRLFSEEFSTDVKESVILNAAAVKNLGIEGNPIGQSVQCNWPKSTRKIVGVIDDIHFESLYNKIKPAIFLIHYPVVYHMIIKVVPSDEIGSMNAITEICQSFYPYEVIEFSFLDSILEFRYKKDITTFQLMGFFAALAIFLACMGLLGISTFIISSKTKEIGIRKVNGAKAWEIIQLLNVGFVKWIAIAFVIATPLAYYAMSRWLESFAYRIELSWWIFAISGLATVLIVLSTVSWVTFKAARRNPVESLRYE
ncbi:MAG: ABC transporter permease [Bacteroidetes bacterium]|nr:ABC transporter permease [Bacteroidota bacterium]